MRRPQDRDRVQFFIMAWNFAAMLRYGNNAPDVDSGAELVEIFELLSNHSPVHNHSPAVK